MFYQLSSVIKQNKKLNETKCKAVAVSYLLLSNTDVKARQHEITKSDTIVAMTATLCPRL